MIPVSLPRLPHRRGWTSRKLWTILTMTPGGSQRNSWNITLISSRACSLTWGLSSWVRVLLMHLRGKEPTQTSFISVDSFSFRCHRKELLHKVQIANTGTFPHLVSADSSCLTLFWVHWVNETLLTYSVFLKKYAFFPAQGIDTTVCRVNMKLPPNPRNSSLGTGRTGETNSSQCRAKNLLVVSLA